MDTTTLVVGQKVKLYGCGYWKGTVVSVTPDGVGVASDDGFAQFDKEGNETKDSLYRRVGVLGGTGAGPEWQPWELKSLEEEHFASNVSSWLIKFLKDGEKPADEIFKEAEKKFGNAGDGVRRASDELFVSKRQGNRRWYWLSLPTTSSARDHPLPE